MLKNKFSLDALKSQGEKLCVRAISAWCFMGLFNLITLGTNFTTVDFTLNVNLLLCAVVFIGCFFAISVAERFLTKYPIDSYFLLLTLFPYVLVSMQKAADNYYSIGMLAILAAGGYYILRTSYDGFLDRLRISKKSVIIAATLMGAFFVIYIGGVSAIRYWSYRTPCFDFGIFSQMFYYMKETFQPLVTCERDGLLSHFAVHFSPIYYLLLPAYMIFPNPATLEIGQAVIIASGLIPLYLLCRSLKLSDKATLCVLAVYAFFPALAGGTYYDLHENKFLAPLILWLLFFIEKKKTVGIFAFALLVCLVKEDAPVYIAFTALYVLISKKDLKRGLTLLAFSLAYFAAVLYFLDKYGQGAMVNRYDNFIFNQDLGLVSVIITCFVNPLYVFKECFNPDKMVFALLMLLPTGFLCFATKKYSRFILVGPFMLINLMPDYVYQHSIYFQYTYASAVFLIYLAAVNASELKAMTRRYMLSFASVASIALFLTCIMGMRSNYFWILTDNAERAEIASLTSALDVIPDDAEVTADTFLVANLSSRDVIYQSDTQHTTEWLALDLRGLVDDGTAGEKISKFTERGYEMVEYVDGVVAVMKLPN